MEYLHISINNVAMYQIEENYFNLISETNKLSSMRIHISNKQRKIPILQPYDYLKFQTKF